MIEQFNIYGDLFKQINDISTIKLHLYIIGGAALLYREIKPATKDVDIIVKSKEEYDQLTKILIGLDFKVSEVGKGYEHLEIGTQFVKDNIYVDLFLNNVCSKFSFSDSMVERSEEIISLNNIKVYLGSNEDIFVFKTMTERSGDLDDCVALAMRGLEWDEIFNEITAQIQEFGEHIWITWINERLIKLEKSGIVIPILGEIDKMAVAYIISMENK